MNILLLDTHALIWLMEGDSSLGKQACCMIDVAATERRLTVSAITFWETAMLQQRHKIEVAQSVRSWREKVLDLGILEISITGEIGIMATELENFHADPADRIITATAITYNGSLITADKKILNWSSDLLRYNARL